MNRRGKQIAVGVGMFGAVTCASLAFWVAPAPSTSWDQSLAFTWLLVPAACLILGVAATAHARFVGPYIDGEGAPAGSRLEILTRYN